jgi:Ca-activated chloride channel family protein
VRYAVALSRLVIMLVLVMLLSCQPAGDLTYSQAVARLDDLLKGIAWSQQVLTRKVPVSLTTTQVQDTLPDITKFALVVNPPASPHDVVVEIFTSMEKAGQGTDGWLVEVANSFNRSHGRLRSGRTARVALRAIASDTAYEFIATRKYIPEAYAPSNHLWLQMVAAHDIPLVPIRERLLGNTAGVVMKKRVLQTLKAKYGTVGVAQVIDAVVQGSIAMGYTDPYASSTGLNFLVTVLATLARGDTGKLLADDVVSAFTAFQRGVPFVSLTTLQMREAVQQERSLDAFVMEQQAFVQTSALQAGYAFVPFGVRHDNPLYGLVALSAEKREVLEQFAQFASQEAAQKLATDYGFNRLDDYAAPFPLPAGEVVLQAQNVWKRQKDAGKPIAAVFLCDVSGSMDGVPLQNLKRALLTGSQFIAAENAIGLVVFSDSVQQLLPIQQLTSHHRAMFAAAVQEMTAGGQTAMYNGMLVALKMLVTEKAVHPDSKPLLFVLTDGQTNAGLAFDKVKAVLAGLSIPIYTIGYNARIDVLRQISALNEAASLTADQEDIVYKMAALLNAEM